MAHDSWMYGDPMQVAMRRQEDALRKEKNCGDCVNRDCLVIQGQKVVICTLKRKKYGFRCDLYKKRG